MIARAAPAADDAGGGGGVRARASLVVAAALLIVVGGTGREPATRSGAAEPTVVWSLDFANGSWDPSVQSGGPALSVVDDAGKVLQVADRANDFDGIKSPAMFEAGVEYVFSMDVKLATPGTAQFRFVTDPGFTWIGNTTVNGDGWTTVTGSFTPTAARRRRTSAAETIRSTAARTRISSTTSSSPPSRPSRHHRRPSESSSAPTSKTVSAGGWHAAPKGVRRWRSPPPRRTLAPRRRWCRTAPVRATASGTTSPASWSLAAPTRSRPG